MTVELYKITIKNERKYGVLLSEHHISVNMGEYSCIYISDWPVERGIWLFISLIACVIIFLRKRNMAKTILCFFGVASVYFLIQQTLFPFFYYVNPTAYEWDMYRYSFMEQFCFGELPEEPWFEIGIDKFYWLTVSGICLSTFLLTWSFKGLRSLRGICTFVTALELIYFLKIWITNLVTNTMMQCIDLKKMLLMFVGVCIGYIAFIISRKLKPEWIEKIDMVHTK